MITKELLKKEIDKVNNEYLDVLYRVIKAFELTPEKELVNEPDKISSNSKLNWHEFIDETYGSLADDPIERGKQGEYEKREIIE